MANVHNATNVVGDKAWKNALGSTMQILFKIDEKVVTLQMMAKDRKKNQGRMNALILEMRFYFPTLDQIIPILSLGGGRLSVLWLSFKNSLGGNVVDVDPELVFKIFKELLVVVNKI